MSHAIHRGVAHVGLLVLCSSPVLGQSVLYVDADAVGPAHDGLSWCTAFTDLQEALGAAGDSGGTVAEIRIAAGVYVPGAPGSNRNTTFQLVNGVSLIGGFAGCGATDPHERDIDAFETILSGDYGGNDVGGLDDPSRDENAYHVASGNGVDARTAVDGMTFLSGNADNFNTSVTAVDKGGGLRIIGGSPTLIDCTFVGNRAMWGGGVFCEESASTFVRCTFVGNFATQRGGGACNRESELSFIDCAFFDNETYSPNLSDPNRWWGNGGGMHNFSSEVTLLRCVFSGNLADGHGDSSLNQPTDGLGGCVYNNNSGGTYTDCRFVENIAEAYGAGVHNQNNSDPVIVRGFFKDNLCTAFDWWEGAGAGANCWASYPTFMDCHFENHEADHGACYHAHGCSATFINTTITESHAGFDPGGAAYLDHSTPLFVNCILSNNTAENGAGVYMRANSAPTFTHCLFIGNHAEQAGGAVFETVESGSTFMGCTIAGNLADTRSAGLWHGSTGSTTFENTLLWNNTALLGTTQEQQITFLGGGTLTLSYNCVEGWDGALGGVGNMGDDPLLADLAGGDARLSAGSPAINAGDPGFVGGFDARDLDGHARVLCGRVDMGAFEFGIGDANCDQSVDLSDFDAWGACWTGPEAGPFDAGCEPFDFDGDEDVDFRDFGGFQRVFGL